MVKSLLQFGLTRSAIVVLGLVVFCAAGLGVGSQVQRPLATIVAGGMFIGPQLLLVVAPALRKTFLSGDAEHVETAGEPVAVTQGSSDG